jgi:hypothetical protein
MSDLTELQDLQRGYDLLYWKEKDNYKDLRHIQLHMNKMMGKIASITEPYEHGENNNLDILQKDIIPDLLIYALHLAIKHYKYPADMEKAYRSRLSRNIKMREKLE